MKKIVVRATKIFAAIYFANFCLGTVAFAESTVKSTAGTEVTKAGGKLVSTTTDARTPAYNGKALHRLDFRVVGKSCAVCLLNIQKRVSTVSGAVKAAVQLQPPYAAVVLYDSSKTTQKAIMDKAKETIPDVKFEAIEDKPIDKLPLVLVPKISTDGK